MRIGTIEVKNPVFLAPMAGVTDWAFRTVCAELGAGVTVTEMVSSRALVYRDQKSAKLLRKNPGSVCGAQIFGNDPDTMAEGARLALEISGCDFLDINMGCPMPESGEQRRRLRPDAHAGAGGENRGSRSQSGGRARHGQMPPGLGQGQHQRAGLYPAHGGQRRGHGGRSRAHPEYALQRHRRLGRHPQGQGAADHPRHCQRRYHRAARRRCVA